MDRSVAEALDRTDPLAGMRAHFAFSEGGPIYLDGNSLGRPPKETVAAVAAAPAEWAAELVGGWDRWIDLPATVGDRLGRLLGAAPGQVLVCDSTTVNLYKLAAAALRDRPGRPVVVADAADFPTDRYVLEGLAAADGRQLRLIDSQRQDPDETAAALADAVDDRTALVCLSHVNYRSGARLDVGAITAAAHEHGALVLWDLAHSAGAVPVELDRWSVDLATGCTYKYLNSGPGAPGYLYVARSLQDRLRQPIQGWFGQANQFEMGASYTPAPGVGSFMTGTPGIIGLRAVDASLAVTEAAGVDRLWAKSERMTELMMDLVERRLSPLGATLATPRAPGKRGGHVSVAHPDAWPWCRALIDQGLVVGDFRTPDVIRLGPAPLYTRYVDCFDAIGAMAGVLASGVDGRAVRGRVT